MSLLLIKNKQANKQTNWKEKADSRHIKILISSAKSCPKRKLAALINLSFEKIVLSWGEQVWHLLLLTN